MRTQWLVTITVICALVVGLVAGVGASGYLRDLTSGNVTVSGLLRYAASDPTASGVPPAGYYVDSTATERVYVETSNASDYLGVAIRASGRLTTLCGADGVPCYPLIKQAVIERTP